MLSYRYADSETDQADGRSGIRSVSESHFHVDEPRGRANINRNQSTPTSFLRVTEFLMSKKNNSLKVRFDFF